MQVGSPAQSLAARYQWLTQSDESPIVRLEASAPNQLRIVVRDSWSVDEEPAYHDEMNRSVADTAAGMLEPVVAGVRLLVQTEDGYTGQPCFSSADSNYFATGLPGVQAQVGEVGYDVDGDGAVGKHEAAYLFEVDTESRAAALDQIIVDRYGRYPVAFAIG